jgi:hypothetical protein
MAIVQISKIIHRTGSFTELPQLDAGEIGFATDEQRVFIGNDPNIVSPVGVGATTQTEILTDASPLDFSRIDGASNSVVNMANIQTGDIIVANYNANFSGYAWENWKGNLLSGNTGNANVKVNLGAAGNLKIAGGVNGFVLQTDGTGNLTWTTNGTLSYKISNISPANVSNINAGTVINTSTPHFFGTGTVITISDVLPTIVGTAIQTAGFNGTNQFWTRRISANSFSIHDESNVASTSGFVPYNALWAGYTANSGNVLGQISPTGNAVPGGANTQVQFQDTAGAFGGSANLVFDRVTNTLTVTGNTNSSNFNGIFNGSLNGIIGATTANLATFTSVTVNNNANVAGNLNVSNVSVSSNLSANNIVANTVTTSAYMQLAVYANNTTRDTAIPTPNQGMLVFNQASSKFQGYDGTAWVNLN